MRSVQKRIRSVKNRIKVLEMFKSAQNYEISSKTGKTSKKQLSKMLKLTHYEFVYVLCESTRRVRRQDRSVAHQRYARY